MRKYILVTSSPVTPFPSTLFVYTSPKDVICRSANRSYEGFYDSWFQRRDYESMDDFIKTFSSYIAIETGDVDESNEAIIDSLVDGDLDISEIKSIKNESQKRNTVRGKSLGWVDRSVQDFLLGAPTVEFKDGSYTKPELRERIKNRIMAGSKGGAPGQWSARKAQLLALAYRKAGGGYRGKPRKTQRSLKKWTREKWRTSDGKPAIRKGGTNRYLPSAAWSRLTPAQRAATNRKKREGSKSGRQFVRNTEAAARAGKNARD